MSKLGVMVLPTTSSNIASVPRTFNSAKDETSIVPPSLIKAEVKAKKEFIDKVVNPGRDSDRVCRFIARCFVTRLGVRNILEKLFACNWLISGRFKSFSYSHCDKSFHCAVHL